jgi:hypothetical protein
VNRYLIFAGMDYEERGGWSDFISSHATAGEACRQAWHMVGKPLYEYLGCTWAHVVDLETLDVSWTVVDEPKRWCK